MGEKSKIQWTDITWNIARGCTKVNKDCLNCYMYRDSMDKTRYDPYQVVRTKTVFNLPLRIKEPSRIFTCSLTDFFHPQIDSYRHEAWDIIRKCPQHTFQILTKRPERISECLPPDWGEGWSNVWLGTSVGSMESIDFINELHKVPAQTKFLSLEPLWAPIEVRFHLIGIDWVIVGGESGHEKGKYRYRPCQIEWIENIVYECLVANVPVFVKQLGTYLSKELHMSDRHGSNIDEFPEQLRLRLFPNELK